MLSELPTNLGGFREPCSELRGNYDDLDSLDCTRKISQPSNSSTMSDNFRPTFVYRRKKQQKDSVAKFAVPPSNGSKPSHGCYSSTSSEAPSSAAKKLLVYSFEHSTEAIESPIVDPAECGIVAVSSSSGCHDRTEIHSEQALRPDVGHVLSACTVIDNCSSSKSNLELSSASLKVDMDDAGECSSSVADMATEEISERDVCISIGRSQGLFSKGWTRNDRCLNSNTVQASGLFCIKPCKVCECMESTLKMLVCDNCEDAYHISCCNPHITVLPIGEWFCESCLKNKQKLLNDKSTTSTVTVGSQSGRKHYSTSDGQLGSFEFMFRDTEPHLSNVRIGDDFQANVPDWCGQIYEDCNVIDEPLEMDPFHVATFQKKDSTRALKISSIGNWIQCRQVVEGVGEDVNGTVCAKWRRAPLFEVQTDDWECFRCVIWDPAHADCSVPQELDTDEVMKQLKYMEMLRPRLAAKRRKIGCSKV